MNIRLSYILLPKPESALKVAGLQFKDGCLSFRSTTRLSHGMRKVAVKTSSGWTDLEIDVFHYDQILDIYQAKVLRKLTGGGGQPEVASDTIDGTIEEYFKDGTTVRIGTAPPIGSYLKLELEAEQKVTLAEAIWVNKRADHYSVRLRYHDLAHLDEVTGDEYVQVGDPPQPSLVDELVSPLQDDSPLEERLQEVLALAREQVGAERGCMLVTRAGVEQLLHDGDDELRDKFPFSRNLVGEVMAFGTGLVSYQSQACDLPGSQSMMLHGVRAAMCAPILSLNDDDCGVVYFDNRGSAEPFSEEQLKLVQSLALRLGHALS